MTLHLPLSFAALPPPPRLPTRPTAGRVHVCVRCEIALRSPLTCSIAAPKLIFSTLHVDPLSFPPQQSHSESQRAKKEEASPSPGLTFSNFISPKTLLHPLCRNPPTATVPSQNHRETRRPFSVGEELSVFGIASTAANNHHFAPRPLSLHAARRRRRKHHVLPRSTLTRRCRPPAQSSPRRSPARPDRVSPHTKTVTQYNLNSRH